MKRIGDILYEGSSAEVYKKDGLIIAIFDVVGVSDEPSRPDVTKIYKSLETMIEEIPPGACYQPVGTKVQPEWILEVIEQNRVNRGKPR